MSSFCIDELSPISVGSSNVNNFVLTPNLLLHADDSVKSDDLDLSLLECSFSDDGSGVEVSPYRCQSHTDVDGGVKGVPCAGDKGLGTFADIADCPPCIQHCQHSSCTSNDTKTAEVSEVCALSTDFDHKHKELEPPVESKPVLHYISAPNSPLHETFEPPVKKVSQVKIQNSPSYKNCGNSICKTNSLSFEERSPTTNCLRAPAQPCLSTNLSKVFSQTVPVKGQHAATKCGTTNATESDAEPNTTYRARNKALCQTPGRAESATTPAYIAQKPKHLQKRKKFSRIKSFIIESDSDTSVDFKKSRRKLGNESVADSYTVGIELESPIPLRRSLRKPKRRFKLVISDSESDLPGPVRKIQRRPRRRKSSSSSDWDLQVPLSGLRRSQRKPKKKAYTETEYTEFNYDPDGNNIQECRPVSDQQPAKNQRENSSCLGRRGERYRSTNPQQPQKRTDSQLCSPDFIPVAQVVYHHQSTTEQKSTSFKNQGNNVPKSGEAPCSERNSLHTIEDQSELHQTEHNSFSGQAEPETRAERRNQNVTWLENTETHSRSQILQNSSDFTDTPRERRILSEASEGQTGHNPGKTNSVEPAKPQSEDVEKENVSLNSNKVQVKPRLGGRQVQSETTDGQVSSRPEKVTLHSTPKCQDKQVIPRETSKPKRARVSTFRRKVSETEDTQGNSTGKSRSKSKLSKEPWLFKVKFKESFDPLYTQKLRKNKSLFSIDKSDQKERDCSVSEPLNMQLSFQRRRNVLSDDNQDESCSELAVCTKKQRDLLLKDRNEKFKQSSKTSTRCQGQECTKAENNHKKLQVKSKRKILPPTDKAQECSDKDILPQTLETKVSSRGWKSNPHNSADSDRTLKRKALSKLNTSENVDNGREGRPVKRNGHYYNRKKGVRAKGTHNWQRGGEEKAFNLISLTRAIATETDAIEFCQQYGLLPQSSLCPKCGGLLTKLYKIVRKVKTFSVEFRFQCNKKSCKNKSHVPLRNVCWLSKSTKLLCCQHLLIFYLFSNQFTAEQAVEESVISCENIHLGCVLNKKQVNSVCLETVQELYMFCREIYVLSLPDPQPVGGANHTVVILEAQFGKTRYCSRVFPEGQIVLGAFCRQTENVLFVPCPALESEHVIPVIQKYVRKGSEVQTNNSEIYTTLGELGYKHVALNHSQHDLDSETGRCLKHNKDSIWWMKKAPSTSTGLDKSATCTSKTTLFSSVVSDIKEPVGMNSESSGSQKFTPVDDSVKRKLKKCICASDSADVSGICDLSSISGTFSSSEKPDETHAPNNPKVLFSKTVASSSSRSVSAVSSDSSEGFDTSAIFSTSENSVTMGTSGIGSSIDTASTSGRDRNLSTGADNWIFALHMGEFLWRRIHRDDKDIFLSFLQATAKVFPFDQH